MSEPDPPNAGTFRSRLKRYLTVGLFTAIPLWITWLVVSFGIGLVTGTVGGLLHVLAERLRLATPGVASVLRHP